MPHPCPHSTTAGAHRRNGALPETGAGVMMGLSTQHRESSKEPLHMAVQNTSSRHGQTYQTASQGPWEEKHRFTFLFSLVSCCQGQADTCDTQSGHIAATKFGKEISEISGKNAFRMLLGLGRKFFQWTRLTAPNIPPCLSQHHERGRMPLSFHHIRPGQVDDEFAIGTGLSTTYPHSTFSSRRAV